MDDQQGKKRTGEVKAGENPTREHEEKNSLGEEKESRTAKKNYRKSGDTTKEQADPHTEGGREREENPLAGS